MKIKSVEMLNKYIINKETQPFTVNSGTFLTKAVIERKLKNS